MISPRGYGGRYREVVTPHSRELSWLFKRLAAAFSPLLDSCNKFEFFGRLELAANDAIKADSQVCAADLCNAVLDEAIAMIDAFCAGDLDGLAIADGHMIAADLTRTVRR